MNKEINQGKFWHLLPIDVVADVVKVISHGAKKHSPDGWKALPKDIDFDHLMEHLSEWKSGKNIEDESGLPHLAHAITRLMFLYWKDKKYNLIQETGKK